MSLFDSGCDDGTAGASPRSSATAAVEDQIATVDRYMGDLDRALTRAPVTMPRRRAWGTLLAKWREFVAAGGSAPGVANRYVTVAGAFAAELGAAAPTPPVVMVVPQAPAKESHWLRWTLIVGGLGAAGWYGWRWYASRHRGGTTGPGEALPEGPPAPVLPELQEKLRGLTAPEANTPAWVRDDAIWARATGAVRPYWESYDDPGRVVAEIYRKMGGRVAMS